MTRDKMLQNKRGIILIVSYLVIVVLIILGSAFLTQSFTEKRIAEKERALIQAFYLAEAGIDRVAVELFNTFQNAYPRVTAHDFNWFDGLDDNPRTEAPPYAGPPADVPLGEGVYSIIISGVTADPIHGTADVTLESTGSVKNVQRTIKTVVRYAINVSEVFDYTYFINNFGWLLGGGITANGNVRSNGNFSFGGNPTINGDIFASENDSLGADGSISGLNTNDTIAYYRAHADEEARPTNPTAEAQDIDGDGTNEEFPYASGYDGASERLPAQEVIDMSYLGNLDTYKELAAIEGGRITQNGNVLVNGVYGDDVGENGPDGIAGTADDGCVVLIGTEAAPLEISGTVVVEGDVIIRGVVSGQGIIYSGRNTHIIGDLTYEEPPVWPKPDTTPAQTDVLNDTRDFLGLASKGNVIIGDYTRNDWLNTVKNYLKPPFTQAYETDATDADIGYDSDGNPANGYSFNGNYTTNDGGLKDNGAGGSAARKYYESSLSDNFIKANSAPSNQIRRIDAVSYTNHAFAGKVGEFTLDGTLVSRDEAIIYSGHIFMNYDLRAKSKGNDFNLPGQLAPPQILQWEEK